MRSPFQGLWLKSGSHSQSRMSARAAEYIPHALQSSSGSYGYRDTSSGALFSGFMTAANCRMFSTV